MLIGIVNGIVDSLGVSVTGIVDRAARDARSRAHAILWAFAMAARRRCGRRVSHSRVCVCSERAVWPPFV